MNPKLIAWEFNRLHLIPTKWKGRTIEEDGYKNRRKGNSPNPTIVQDNIFLSQADSRRSADVPNSNIGTSLNKKKE